jgi:hypothetical protein
MRRSVVNGMIVLAATSVWGCATKEVPAPPPPAVASVEKQDSPERLERSNTIQITAAVTKVDLKKRLVTLKDAAGEEETISVGPEVRNLDQVHRGDEVTVTYHESIIFQLYKPGEAEPGVGMAGGVQRAELGEKPGAVGAQAVTITATVVAVDKQKPSITLKKPDGEVVTLPVRKASRLDPVKVGDLLNVTYQRAVAISVEKPQKR